MPRNETISTMRAAIEKATMNRNFRETLRVGVGRDGIPLMSDIKFSYDHALANCIVPVYLDGACLL